MDPMWIAILVNLAALACGLGIGAAINESIDGNGNGKEQARRTRRQTPQDR
jgi:hypothetical protein